MAMQFCGACGKPRTENQLFCQHCGARNDENVLPAAGARPDEYSTNAAASRVDEHATHAAGPSAQTPRVTPGGTMYCGECGFLLAAQDRACRRCGSPVEYPNALIADRAISDAPTVGVSGPNVPGYLAPPQTNAPAVSSVGYPAPPPTNAPVVSSAGYPVGAPPQAAPQYSYYPQQAGVPYPASTFSTPPPAGWPDAGRGGVAVDPRLPPRPPMPGPRPGGQRWPLIVAVVLVALAMVIGGTAFLLLRPSSGITTNGNPTATTAHGPATATTTTGTATATTGITQTPVTPNPTQVVLTPDTASALINQFYSYINARNFDAAYDLLSTQFQQTQSRQNFKDGFQTTVQDNIVISSAETLSDGTVQVDVTLTAQDNKNGTLVTSVYQGYYIVNLENGQLRILKGHLVKQS